MILVDTSAFLAFLDASDLHHPRALATMRDLRGAHQTLITHEYVILETIALVQRRLGMESLRRMADAVLPLVEVVWVDEQLHLSARASLISAGRGKISLVDWTSFLIMRRHGIHQTFTFDADFATEGFEVLPAPG